MDQLPEDGEASSDLANPHVLYRKVIEYVGAADQLASLSQEVPSLNNAPQKKALNMPRRMYSIIHLSEIMRLSAFPIPLFYPSF